LTRVVVKDSKPKKSEKKVEKNLGGRPPRDPDTLRTERLVVRIHPDLMRWLTKLATENGITRSLLVERSLVTFVNLSQPEPILDAMGRELQAEPPEGAPLGTPESFASIWKRAFGGEYKRPHGRRTMPPGWKPERPSDLSGNPEDDE
jgi:hypothetical protein